MSTLMMYAKLLVLFHVLVYQEKGYLVCLLIFLENNLLRKETYSELYLLMRFLAKS